MAERYLSAFLLTGDKIHYRDKNNERKEKQWLSCVNRVKRDTERMIFHGSFPFYLFSHSGFSSFP